MKEQRAWQRMLSGRRLDLINPSPLDIELEDIAHGLARVARWNGQTRGDHAFSVAQHCVLVEKILFHLNPAASTGQRLMALLHDAPEYVVGDMISPFKAVLGLDYKAFERQLLSAIHLRFGLPASAPPAVEQAIKQADKVAAYLEATQLAGFDILEAETYFGRPEGLSGQTVTNAKLASPHIPPQDAVLGAACDFYQLVPLPASLAARLYLNRFSTLLT